MERPILAAMLSCGGTHLTEEEKRFFSHYNPLGVTLFNRNLSNDLQIKKLINEIKETIGREDVLIAIDEEGGRVSRLVAAGHPRYVAPEFLGEVAPEYSCYHAELIANELRRLGINVNYAPVIDRKTNPQAKVLEGRCFSSDTAIIVQRASVMVQTYADMGICPCIKHIPGHFSSEADPHLEIPYTMLSKKEIEDEISYMQKFSQYPLAMTAHIVLKNIDSEYPATLSSKVIEGLVRTYLKFENFLLSDAIEMYALKGNIAERIKYCLNAGVDAICCCSGKIGDIATICQEQRFLTEKSLIRFAKIKKVIHNIPKQADIKADAQLYNAAFKNKRKVKYSYDATEVLHQMQKGENL